MSAKFIYHSHWISGLNWPVIAVPLIYRSNVWLSVEVILLQYEQAAW